MRSLSRETIRLAAVCRDTAFPAKDPGITGEDRDVDQTFFHPGKGNYMT